jgi:hypothetical protein
MTGYVAAGVVLHFDLFRVGVAGRRGLTGAAGRLRAATRRCCVSPAGPFPAQVIRLSRAGGSRCRPAALRDDLPAARQVKPANGAPTIGRCVQAALSQPRLR